MTALCPPPFSVSRGVWLSFPPRMAESVPAPRTFTKPLPPPSPCLDPGGVSPSPARLLTVPPGVKNAAGLRPRTRPLRSSPSPRQEEGCAPCLTPVLQPRLLSQAAFPPRGWALSQRPPARAGASLRRPARPPAQPQTRAWLPLRPCLPPGAA